MLHSQKRLFRKDERKDLSPNSVREIWRVVTDWEVSLEKVQSFFNEILPLVAHARYEGRTTELPLSLVYICKAG